VVSLIAQGQFVTIAHTWAFESAPQEGLFMAQFNARMYDAWIVTANR
jgi:hypothetical protein